MNSTASTRFLEQITNITRMERDKLTVICETAKGSDLTKMGKFGQKESQG
jgi:hypothetical protein